MCRRHRSVPGSCSFASSPCPARTRARADADVGVSQFEKQQRGVAAGSLGAPADLDRHVRRDAHAASLRRSRTTMNPAIAAAAISSPVAPMKIAETTPRAAMAPSTARIGPMQQATHATAATPRIDPTPERED